MNKLIGVLALQGDFAEHVGLLRSCGYRCMEVRTIHDLDTSDALVIPGGESTAIIKLIDRWELREQLVKRIESGMPVFGTCAGAIILARASSDGEAPLGVLDISVARNAYGRQTESFEAEVASPHFEGPLKGAFIRAPVITDVSPQVEVLAEYGGDPVLVRKDNLLASTFHPEIAGETRVHRFFLEVVCTSN